MNFFKKQRTAFYGLVVAAILALVGIIIFEGAFKAGNEFFAQQNIDAGSQVALFGILAIVLFVVAIALSQLQLKGATDTVVSIVADVAIVGACVLLGCAFVSSVSAYVYDICIVLFSDLHNGDDVVINACWNGVASSVIMIVGIFVAGITSCFSVAKK